MCDHGRSPAPASLAEALAMAHAAMDFLNRADVAAAAVAEQAQCLTGLELLEAKRSAAQARALSAFASARGPEADGQYSPKAWLRHFTRITPGAAGATVAQARRLAGHPAVADALAAGVVSVSWARQLCEWSSMLQEHRGAADLILVTAAAQGADLDVLSRIAAEIYQRVCPDGPQRDAEDVFGDRFVRLGVTFGGAGRLEGDLTPDAAAAVTAVLEALGAKAGPEDTRSRGQRHHDALAEACRRLIAAGIVPQRAGCATQVQVGMHLAALRALPGAATVEAGWIGRLTGATAQAMACDATIAPVVVGHVDHQALEHLADIFLAELAPPGAPARDTEQPMAPSDRARLQEKLLRWAIEVLSGPDGLAAELRTGLLDGPLASKALPLDVGKTSRDVPPHLRRAVIARDRHCAFPGCDQPPAACQVHHVVPRSRGGPTALSNLVLACAFHHLIVIHNWGWKLHLHPDGAVTAISPGGRTLHSHSPPVAA